MNLRTTDTEYGAHYWNSMDDGRGYQDSLLWEDLAFIVKELLLIDRDEGVENTLKHRVLDVGCAYGYLVKHLRRRGNPAFGVDFSKYALENAPEDTRRYLEWFDLTGEQPIWGTIGGRFDVITCFETMEHIPEESVAQALSHIFEALDSGGVALFTICTDKQDGWDTDPTHITIKPREWWVPKLQEAGFVLDDELVERFRWFWLFLHHDGVFLGRKP